MSTETDSLQKQMPLFQRINDDLKQTINVTKELTFSINKQINLLAGFDNFDEESKNKEKLDGTYTEQIQYQNDRLRDINASLNQIIINLNNLV
jgi:hypothetical protein